MGKIVAGLASSHAYALQEPDRWDAMRRRTLERFRKRYGFDPPDQPRVLREPLNVRAERYQRVRDGLAFLRDRLREKKPEVLILVGDDQDENFTEDNLPQISIYIGDQFSVRDAGQPGGGTSKLDYRSHSKVASALLHGLVQRDFDVAYTRRFRDGLLLSHAHCQILTRMVPEADIPIVLLFMNAIHVPAISPARCYRLGLAIKSIIMEESGEENVAVYGSGGLSHFTAGYPWLHYKGNFTLGSISEEFDREAVQLLARGEGERLSAFTSRDLLDNGEIELRSWLVVAGVVGAVRPQLLVYEPFYSGVMGMGVGYWEL